MSRFSAIDLFSGCGGLTRGLRDAGFRVVAACEIRPEARVTYKLNHRRVTLYEDIRRLKGEFLMNDAGLKYGELDLLAACPPCQGFSSMRTRNQRTSEDDNRNELIFEVSRLVREVFPKCVVIENVPALLKDARLARFRRWLKRLGYHHIEAEVLNAEDFQVPQRRKRMIFFASRIGPIELPRRSKKEALKVEHAIGHLPAADSNHGLPLHAVRQELMQKTLKRISAIPKNGGSRRELPRSMQLRCHQHSEVGFNDVYGRMKWDHVSPTITRFSHNPSKGRFVHPEEDRGMTLMEAMLLQGFPDNYKFPVELGIGKISSMIGEAFPPPFAKAQGLAIKKHLRRFS